MTTNSIRKKVIEYVNHADKNVLEVVYKLLSVYEGDMSETLMNEAQKTEIEHRSNLLKKGKLKTSTWSEVKAIA